MERADRLGRIVQEALLGVEWIVPWEELRSERQGVYRKVVAAIEQAILDEMTQQGRVVVVALAYLRDLERLVRIARDSLDPEDRYYAALLALEVYPDWQGEEWDECWAKRFAEWEARKGVGAAGGESAARAAGGPQD